MNQITYSQVQPSQHERDREKTSLRTCGILSEGNRAV